MDNKVAVSAFAPLTCYARFHLQKTMNDENVNWDIEAQRFWHEPLISHCCDNGLHADCSGQVIEDTHEDHFINHGECQCQCHQHKCLDLLVQIRAAWINDREQFPKDSKEAIRLHFGIYALDEAINTIESGKVWRYPDNGILLESMLMRPEAGSKIERRLKPRSV